MPTWNPETKAWENAPVDKPYIEITPKKETKPVTLGSPVGVPSNVVTLGQPTPAKPQGRSFSDWALEPLEPFREMYEDYSGRQAAGRERMGKGIEQLGEAQTFSDYLAGGFKVGTGAMEYVASPIETGIHMQVGAPIEKGTGIPSSYTDFATGLAIPGYGLRSAGVGATGLPAKLGEHVERIFSPSTLSPEAEAAAGSIRSQHGIAARETMGVEQGLEQFRGTMNSLPDADKMNFMHAMESSTPLSSKATWLPPGTLDAANKMRDAFQVRRTKLERYFPDMTFVEDYFPHMWKDPKQAQQVGRDMAGGIGFTRQGSGASLKGRSVPTITEGLARGLEPVTKDPIELSMMYIQSMDRFIASHEVLEAGKAQGHIKYFKVPTMGASGHPEAFKPPDGWVAINGRGAIRGDGAQAYAPKDWAKVYNNFIDQGLFRTEEFGSTFATAQRVSNAITATELGLSGYHALTMAKESVISELARGISQLFTPGQRLRAIGTIPTAFAAPIKSAVTGRKLMHVYLGRSTGNADFRKVADLLTEAGGRGAGAKHAPDYSFSAMNDYWTAFQRGAQKQIMAQGIPNRVSSYLRPDVAREGLKGVGQAVKEAPNPFTVVGRSMATVAYPLFQKYIPMVKDGAFYETMQDWLKANPNAAHAEQVAAARKIWDSIDNRFGEMVQDNIFWNKTMKQVATLGMRSYSWNMGTVREIGGGAVELLRDPTRIGSKLNVASADYNPKVAYVIAMPIATATINAVYQFLKTGKAPESVEDLIAPQTGGTAPGFGGRGEVLERVMSPGYEKDVFGWYMDWLREAENKVARAPSLAGELVTGKDWRGDPLHNLQDEGERQTADYFKHVLESVTPISLKGAFQGEKTGSNISTLEQMLGIRPAPSYLQDPEGYQKGMEGLARRAARTRERHERRQRSQYPD